MEDTVPLKDRKGVESRLLFCLLGFRAIITCGFGFGALWVRLQQAVHPTDDARAGTLPRQRSASTRVKVRGARCVGARCAGPMGEVRSPRLWLVILAHGPNGFLAAVAQRNSKRQRHTHRGVAQDKLHITKLWVKWVRVKEALQVCRHAGCSRFVQHAVHHCRTAPQGAA